MISGGVYAPGINSPRHATQDIFAVISEQDDPETFEYKFSSGQTVYYYARYDPSKG